MELSLSFEDNAPIPNPMKVLIAVGIYLFFTVALGVVMATMPPRWICEDEPADDPS